MSTSKTPTNIDDYTDIINLPRPISKTHPRMDKKSRAAQFAPYAALVGHRDIIASEEDVAVTKDNIDCEIITELDPEIPEVDENLENDTNFEFNQENPLDS